MSKQSEAKAAQGYTDPAPQFKGPAKWTDEEIADGNIGIRWVNEAGVQGRPTECDVRKYLERTPTAKGCHCDKCKSFYSSYQTASRTPYGWQVQGLRDTYKGEHAEQDAKAEAARIGGTAYAFPIYIDPTAAIPEGWKLVPVEPTEDMLDEVDEEVGGYCYSCSKSIASDDDCRRVYRAMLAAAPGGAA